MTPEAFRDALDALGWNQTDFAEHTGLTKQTASRWATGQAPIAPWADAHLRLLLDLAALRDRYLIQPRGRADGAAHDHGVQSHLPI